jgi:hypothetical protein
MAWQPVLGEWPEGDGTRFRVLAPARTVEVTLEGRAGLAASSGKPKRENYNACCQDNEPSWINWELSTEHKTLLEFFQRLTALLGSSRSSSGATSSRGGTFGGTEVKGPAARGGSRTVPGSRQMHQRLCALRLGLRQRLIERIVKNNSARSFGNPLTTPSDKPVSRTSCS